MTKLVVRLLGGYAVELDGEAVYGFETDRACALLAYMMVEAGRPHRRETPAGLLWPDRPDATAHRPPRPRSPGRCSPISLQSIDRVISHHKSRQTNYDI
jgi:hypothetical protein